MNKDAANGIPWFQLILTLVLFNVGAVIISKIKEDKENAENIKEENMTDENIEEVYRK